MDVLELVRPERVHRGHLREEAALAAVGALVEHEPCLARDERAVGAGAGLELDHHPLATVPDGDELLAAGEDELDGAARCTGERCHVALEVEVALGAEAAAEEGHDHAHVRLRDLQRLGDAAAGRVGHLRRRPHRHLVALPLRHDRARLDRDAVHRVGHVAALDDDVGVGERGVDVPLHDRRVAERVVVTTERLRALVRLPVGMDERRVVGQRRLEIGHDGQRLVVDLDQRRRLLRDLRRRRRDPRDDIALEANGVLREQAPVLDHAAVEHVGNVLVRDDGEHAGQRPRLRRVDPGDPGVRVVGVAELRDELAGEDEIGRVAARAGHLLLAVRANERPRFLDRRHRQLSSVGLRGCIQSESVSGGRAARSHRRRGRTLRASTGSPARAARPRRIPSPSRRSSRAPRQRMPPTRARALPGRARTP